MKKTHLGVLAACAAAAWAAGCGSSSSAPSTGGDANDAGGIGVDSSSGPDSGVSHPDADASTDSAVGADVLSPSEASTEAGARLAIPMYVDPSTSPALWTEVLGAGPVVGLLVANLDNGPGTAVDSDYTAAITSAHAGGEIVIGYVHTSSAGRALSVVEADVDAWYSFYPNLDGIFVDEVSSDTSTVASYYVPLYTYAKAKAAHVTVAINPGTMVDESFMTASDILVTFEDTYAHYIDPNQNPANPAWVATYAPSRFWNLILSADASVEVAAIDAARARNAGWIYVTAEGPATAYQNIATGSYWTTELGAVSAP